MPCASTPRHRPAYVSPRRSGIRLDPAVRRTPRRFRSMLRSLPPRRLALSDSQPSKSPHLISPSGARLVRGNGRVNGFPWSIVSFLSLLAKLCISAYHNTRARRRVWRGGRPHSVHVHVHLDLAGHVAPLCSAARRILCRRRPPRASNAMGKQRVVLGWMGRNSDVSTG